MTTKTRKLNLMVGMAGFTPQAQTDNHHTSPANLNVRAHYRLLTTTLGTIFLASGTWSAPIKILCVGDSITTGITHVSGTPFYSPGGYRIWLEREANRRGHAVQFVGTQTTNPPGGHEGWPGFSLWGVFNSQGQRIRWGIADVIPTALPWIGGAQPEIVVINGGHNDLAVSAQDSDWAGTITLQNRARNLCQMVHDRRPLATIYLVSANPYATPQPLSWVLAEYDADLPALCATLRAEGLPVWPVRIHGLFGPGDIQDALHPSATGYEKMGTAIARAIFPFAFEPPRRLPRLESTTTTGGNK